jgi:hypothetical protein
MTSSFKPIYPHLSSILYIRVCVWPSVLVALDRHQVPIVFPCALPKFNPFNSLAPIA